ncbi:pilin [Frankia sp. R43]|uniref:pilin n=1 Tax=Frankia sp. R43 TaxID=269536 RepID=UPI000AF11244|nr:pilin [Frankia sp. R43]
MTRFSAVWSRLVRAVRRRVGRVPVDLWLGVCAGLAGGLGWVLSPAGSAPGPGWELVGSPAGWARVAAAVLCAVFALLLLVCDEPWLAQGKGSEADRRRLLRLAVLLAGVVVGVIVLAGVSDAAVVAPVAPPPPAGVSTAPDLETVLTNARNWMMGILATVATFFFTLGAARYASANGDPGEVERAKGSFRNAALGYGLAVLAPLLLKALQSVVGA